MTRLFIFFALLFALVAAVAWCQTPDKSFQLSTMSCRVSLEPAGSLFPAEHIRRACSDQAGNLIDLSLTARSQLVPGREISPYRFADFRDSELDCTLRPAAATGVGSDNGPFEFTCRVRFRTEQTESGTIGP